MGCAGLRRQAAAGLAAAGRCESPGNRAGPPSEARHPRQHRRQHSQRRHKQRGEEAYARQDGSAGLKLGADADAARADDVGERGCCGGAGGCLSSAMKAERLGSYLMAVNAEHGLVCDVAHAGLGARLRVAEGKGDAQSLTDLGTMSVSLARTRLKSTRR